MNIRTKLMILSIIIVLINVLIGYAVFQSNYKLQQSKQKVKHTEKILLQTNNLMLMNKKIESTLRGYILSKDSLYANKLDSENDLMFENIKKIRILTKDNPNQQLMLDSINILMYKRMEYQRNIIELRNKYDLNQMMQITSINQGMNYSDLIQKLIEHIKENEQNILNQVNKETEIRLASFYKFMIILFCIMTVFTIVLLYVTGNYFYQTNEKNKKVKELKEAEIERDFQTEEKEKQTEANKELEAFSYSVSHDLRAPLRHISGFVDLLLKNNSIQLDESGLRYLNIVAVSTKEMGNLIDALLTFSRLNRGELIMSRINSTKLVNQVISTFGEEMGGRIVNITVAELPDVKGEEVLINLVWTNLISNAIKYTKKKETALIDINFKIESNNIVFSIKDNGAGFDMKYSDKLFGVFQRLHKAKDFEGIGIGLANVNRIITRHNGKCWAESEIDKGATFYFSLPNIL